jgi:hypothetical protein
MTGGVVKWQIFCTTESKYIDTFIKVGEPIPIRCPNNTEHSITGIAKMVDIIESSEVSIREEVVPTQGYFRLEGRQMSCLKNSKSTSEVSHPYPVSVYAFYISPISDNIGDILNIYINLGTIDTVTEQLEIGTVSFVINSIPVSNLPIGFEITIDSIPVGEIISKDLLTNTITLSTPITEVFEVGKLIKLRNVITKNFPIGWSKKYAFGLSKIGASHIPLGYTTTVEYTNKSLTNDKELIFYSEYSY